MKTCGSAVKLRERSEHQPQRPAAKATSSPIDEVCG
jgi:hypothetical protein